MADHDDVRTRTDDVRTRILDAAEKLFYERGIQAVGMDELRTAAGVSLKRLYGTFPAKHDLVEAYLRRRDEHWRASLAAYVDAHSGTPGAAPLAVFDWLETWFAAPDFRGCAFINAYGELGATSEGVGRVTREHKLALRTYLADLVRPLAATASDEAAGPGGVTTVLAGQLALLIDGAITAAAVTGDPAAARTARAAAEALVRGVGGGRTGV
ncbi:TetR family transcriptional regulator [Streptomyces albospinus]|uniref:TetR family transcriptional regulator n=1 Tax=Streptomyces albospinus TaxID=285515 RepID=A0ABQ2V8I7_9ACTN|nr:TetR/AcrR family transcriptional regulator [Streptomyces albospinus]GGU71305.1 TetR family transcriptional regulator [Streptomyces albospinus]